MCHKKVQESFRDSYVHTADPLLWITCERALLVGRSTRREEELDTEQRSWRWGDLTASSSSSTPWRSSGWWDDGDCS